VNLSGLRLLPVPDPARPLPEVAPKIVDGMRGIQGLVRVADVHSCWPDSLWT